MGVPRANRKLSSLPPTSPHLPLDGGGWEGVLRAPMFELSSPSPNVGFGAARRDKSLQWSDLSEEGHESYARMADRGGGSHTHRSLSPTPP